MEAHKSKICTTSNCELNCESFERIGSSDNCKKCGHNYIEHSLKDPNKVY